MRFSSTVSSWENPSVFRHEADAAACDAIRGQAVDPFAVERDLAGGRLDPAGDRLEQRRLADAVAAENAEHLAVAHGEVDALDDVARAVVGVQVADVEHGQACPK